jgi:hypothetical protein
MGFLELAYLDPGMGSILWQGILAGLLGGIVFFKQSIAKVLFMFRKKNEQADEE